MEAESSKMGSARISHIRKRPRLEVKDDESSTQAEAQTRRPHRKGNAGKLAGLISLPLDLLFEIFGALQPFDLLRVARTTKEFRRLLMHKSTISVWKSALSQVTGLPECPPGMNEPQWVNLAFDPHCHFCFTTSVRNVEWRFRMRICAKCAKDHLSERMILGGLAYDYDDEPSPMFSTLVPSRPSKRGRRTYMIRDYYAVKEEYEVIKGKEAREAYVKERKKFVEEIEMHAILCEKWTKSQSNDRSSELQQLRDERRLAIVKKLEAMGYGKDIESIRYPDSLHDHKQVKHPQRLTERIWSNIRGSLIEFMEEMRKKRLIREHKELIVARKQSAVKVLRTFKNAELPYTEIMPEGPDFCEFQPIKTILEQPADVDVDESSFTDILPKLPTLIATWRKGINHQLACAMKINNTGRRGGMSMVHALLFCMGYDDDDGIDFDDDDPDDEGPSLNDNDLAAKMRLATTVFQCATCSSPFHDDFLMSSDDTTLMSRKSKLLFYPEVLGHRCLTRSSDLSRTEYIQHLDHCTRTRKRWTARSLRLDLHVQKMVEAVVEVAGMNSATTTPEDMDNLGAWFACLRCAFPRGANMGQTKAYGWRDVVVHQANCHGRAIEELRMLTANEVEEARIVAIDADDLGVHSSNRSEAHWLCTHCRDLPAELEPDKLENVKNHLRNRHEITTPEVNKDYYKKFGAEPAFPAPCSVVLDMDDADIEDSPIVDDPDIEDWDLEDYCY